VELQRELLSRSLRIPTIVITGSYDETIAATAASLGASAFLRKPVGGDVLMKAINSAVERQV
jgi:FixJ family two-component response regulator